MTHRIHIASILYNNCNFVSTAFVLAKLRPIRDETEDRRSCGSELRVFNKEWFIEPKIIRPNSIFEDYANNFALFYSVT